MKKLHFQVKHQNCDVDSLKQQQNGQLKRVASEKTVNSPKDEHSDGVGDWKCNEALNSRTPVVNDVLCQLFVEVIGHEWADNRRPKDDEVNEIVENVEKLIFWSQTEAKRYLWEQQEKEVLKISFEEKRREEDEWAEDSEKNRYSVVENKVEAPPQEKEPY